MQVHEENAWMLRGLFQNPITALLVSQEGIEVEEPSRVRRTLDLYASTNVDIEDAIIVATVEAAGATDLYSYDRDYDRFETITRIEP